MFFLVSGGGNGYENYGEHRKNKRLDETHENLQEKERQGNHVGREEGDYKEKHLSGENVPEKTERKRDHLCAFGDEFYYPDEERDGIPEIEEFPKMI